MYRWPALAGYGLLAACTQLLWLSYAFIESPAHRAMGVSVSAVGDLAAIFPLLYVVLALPFGRWLDVSFERALGLGAVLTGAGGLIRLTGAHSLWWALAGQVVICCSSGWASSTRSRRGWTKYSATSITVRPAATSSRS